MEWLRASGKYLAIIVLVLIMGWFAFVQGERVPLLGYADLGFHELGHMLALVAPELVHFLAGSTTQVLVPLGLVVYFWFRRRDYAGVAFCLAWAGASAQDVSVYVADAPYQRLPLIGGGHHDWATILGPRHFDAIAAADELAAVIKWAGAVVLVAGLVVAVWALIPEEISLPKRSSAAPHAPQSGVRAARKGAL